MPNNPRITEIIHQSTLNREAINRRNTRNTNNSFEDFEESETFENEKGY